MSQERLERNTCRWQGLTDRGFKSRSSSVDNDGDLDVLLGNGNLARTVEPVDDQVMLNDGAGSFTETTASGVSVLTVPQRAEPNVNSDDRCEGEPEAAKLSIFLTAVWCVRADHSCAGNIL